MKTPLILALLFASLAVLKVDAQDDTQPAIKASLQTLGIGARHDDYYIKMGDHYVHLPVRLDSIPDAKIAYKGALAMPIFRKTGSGDQASYTAIATVQFPAPTPNVSNEFLLLFTGSGAAPALVRNDSTSFPENTIRVINALPAPAGILVKNDSPAVMQPGEIRLFPYLPADTNAEVHVAIAVENQWKECANNVFPLASTYRRTIFVLGYTPAGSSHPLVDLMTMAQPASSQTAAPSSRKYTRSQSSQYAQNSQDS